VDVTPEDGIRLPRPLNSFVDRVQDIQQVARLLRQARLVSLVGPGGVGKTRLAVETARTCSAAHQDGSCFVDLATLSEPRDIPAAFTSGLGISHTRTWRKDDPVLQHVSRQQILLVVDNCEHVLPAIAAYIERLLGACPGARVLATTREPLHLYGEHVWRVGPLPVADSDWAGTLTDLERVPAVRLFLDRAQAVDSAFRVTSTNSSAVAEICRKLDGLPLAIELAATRVPALRAAQISERLGDPLNFLDGTPQTIGARHQTLRGALQWSYGLLTTTEQQVFERMAVFVGRWSLEAAESLCAGVETGAASPLQLLTQLVQKSLVLAERDVEGDVHYRLLETVREFAWERLHARREADHVSQMHADYFAGIVASAHADWSGRRQQDGVVAITSAYDNIRSALDWYLANQPESGLRVAHLLTWFWREHGYFAQGRHWLTALLECSPEDSPQRASALIDAGYLAYLEGDAQAASSLLQLALAAARSRADSGGIARALSHLGRVANRLGESDLARCYSEESVQTWRASGDARGLADGLVQAGIVAAEQGNTGAARAAYEECIRLSRATGDDWTCALALRSLGHIMRTEGDLETAKRLFIEALHIWTTLQDSWGIAWCLSGLGYVALGAGALNEARTYFTDCLRVRRSLGAAGSLANSLECFASLAAAEGDGPRAFQLAGAVRQLRASIGDQGPDAETAAFERTLEPVRLQLSAGEIEAAVRVGETYSLAEALALALETGNIHKQSLPARVVHRLTPRERQVVNLIAAGRTNREIANVLVITVSTAERHVANIFRKLGLRSRTELAAWAHARHAETERTATP
jgi:non-specific serine/threonine protein kinase